MATIPVWPKQWSVSFSIQPRIETSGDSSIVHLTTGSNCCSYGSRIPAVFFYSNSFRLQVRSNINSNANDGYTSSALPRNKWSSVKIEQKLNPTGQYIFSVFINNKRVYFAENTRAMEFKNVKVYAGSPWYKPADAYLRNLTYKGFPGNAQSNSF